ncbi:hypothetical protein RSAG8_03660, partial [Rhizoctonia solani AG-8 WAC10335]
MSTPGFAAPVSHRYPSLPRKPFIGPISVRKHFYALGTAPLVGVVLCSLGMGMYFSHRAARINNIQWRIRTQVSPQTPTERSHWHGAGGVREGYVIY